VEQAQSFYEETEEGLSKILSYDIYIQAVFITERRNKLYGPTYKMPTGVTSTVDLVTLINTFSELNKTAGIFTTPDFFDWVDLQFLQDKDRTADEYYQSMALVYYREAYNSLKQFKALPCLAKKVKGVNNYLIPTHLTEELLVHFRLKLNIAPNLGFENEGKSFCSRQHD
jgi:hypothetical protein